MGNENLGEQMAVRNVADDENILWDFVKIFFLTFETNTSFLNLNTILCEFSKNERMFSFLKIHSLSKITQNTTRNIASNGPTAL